MLGNGALLVLKQLPHYHGPIPLLPAAIAGVAAVVVYLLGAHRQRTLLRRPRPGDINPCREVHVLGGLVLALTLVIAAWLLV